MIPERGVGYQAVLSQFAEPEKTTAEVRVLTEVERAWLAGVIDSEGSVFISKVNPRKIRYRRGFFYRPELSVANSDPRLLARVRELIGKGYYGRDKSNQNPIWKDKWQYKGSGTVLRRVLPQILPYLTVKRAVAEAMLRYLEFVDKNPLDGPKRPPHGYDEELDGLYRAVKNLNMRGRAVTPLNEVTSRSWGPKHRGRGGRATKCRSLAEAEKAWLAGVIDGEGSIFLSKVMNRKTRRGFFYLPTITVSNTNRDFLVRVAQIIGEGTVCLAKRGGDRERPRWMYMASSGVIRAIVPQIMPYLIVKKERASLMLQFLEFLDGNPIYGKGPVSPEYYERLDAMYHAIKKLNQKGKGAGIL